MKKEDVIIIGGGPAGMISAIQLKRYGITARVFEKHRLGGLLWNANLVENYPGFPGGIPGPKLVSLFSQQFEALALEPTIESVTSLDFDGNDFLVATQHGRYASSALIIATGTQPNTFPPGFFPDGALGRTFYEVAPLLDVHGKQIAVIGAGDAAFDYAINLSRKNHVIIFNRTKEIKALPLLVQRCATIQSIQYFEDLPVEHVLAEENGLVLKAGRDRDVTVQVDFLIGAIGRKENLPPMSAQLVKEKTKLTKLGRLQVVGDVQNGIYRQTAIAVGDGLKAAMKVYQYLKE